MRARKKWGIRKDESQEEIRMIKSQWKEGRMRARMKEE